MALLSSVFRRPSTIVSLAVRSLGPARSFDRGFAFNSFYKNQFLFQGTQPSASAWRWQEVEGSDEFPFKRTSFEDGRKTMKTRLKIKFNHGCIQVTGDGDIDVDYKYENEAKKEDWRIPEEKIKRKTPKNSTQYRIKFNDDEFIRVTVDDDLKEEEEDNEDCSDIEEEEEEEEEDYKEEKDEYSEDEKEEDFEEEDGDWQSFEIKHIPKKFWTEMKKNLQDWQSVETKHIPKKFWTEMKKDLQDWQSFETKHIPNNFWTEMKKNLHNESEHNSKNDWTELKLKDLLNYLEDQGFKLSRTKSRKPNLKKK